MLRQKVNKRGFHKVIEDFQFCNSTLLSLKLFCHQCLQALAVERREEINKDSVNKIVYCGKSDVIYIWMNNKFSAILLYETLSHWLLHNDPMFKGSTLDDSSSEHNIYIIELNYMDKSIINRNKQLNINTIIV